MFCKECIEWYRRTIGVLLEFRSVLDLRGRQFGRQSNHYSSAEVGITGASFPILWPSSSTVTVSSHCSRAWEADQPILI